MIIDVVKILIAYVLPWSVGWLLMDLFDKNNRLIFGWKFFAACVVGIGCLTWQIFILTAILRIGLGYGLFVAIILADWIILIFILIKQRRIAYLPSLKFFHTGYLKFLKLKNRDRIILIIFILVMLFKIGSSFWQVTHTPTFEFDAWNNWNLRPKVIYLEGQIPLDTESSFYLGGGNKSYPLNDGLWKVWLATVYGDWNENFINMHSVFIYLFLVGIFFFSLPQSLALWARLLATYLLSSIPLLYFHSWVAYADLQMALYVFLTVYNLVVYIKYKENVLMYTSAFFLFMCVWTKNEGCVLVLPIVFAMSLIMALNKKFRMTSWIYYWVTVLVISAPWLVFRWAKQLGVLSGDSSSFGLIVNYHFLDDFVERIFIASHFNFLWLLVLCLIIFRFKLIWRRLDLRYMMMSVAGLFVLYNGVTIFTERDYGMASFTRGMLQIVPLAFYFLVLVVDEVLKNNKQ